MHLLICKPHDEDGNGEVKAVLFAKLGKRLKLTEWDFQI
jgi:hypothetical protein